MGRRARWLYGLPILAFWLVMTAWLWQREFSYRTVDSVASPDPAGTSDAWLALSLQDGQRVGYLHALQTPARREGLDGRQLELQARMALDLLGKSTDLDLSGSIWQATGAERVDFEFAVRSGGHDLTLAGRVLDGQLRAEVESAGEVLPLEMAVDRELVWSGGLGSAVRLPPLEVGERVEIDSFDPVTLSKSAWRLRCVARETLHLAGRAVPTRVLQVTASGLDSRVWVDDDGEVVRAETPLGLVLERVTAAEALAPVESGAGELLEITAIVPRGPRPRRGVDLLELRLSGVRDLSGPAGRLPVDAWQRWTEDGVLRIDSAATAQPPADLSPYLAADVFVQADHPKIRQQAQAIVGVATDPLAQATALHEWVYLRLEKEAVISIPLALEVLDQRRGDCNEHTVLFTALARSIGLPTRIAIGLVWSDELGGFYYHAWPEVFTGEWLRLDPTLGQLRADATHLKLASGGIEDWPRLLPFLGKLEIEVVRMGG